MNKEKFTMLMAVSGIATERNMMEFCNAVEKVFGSADVFSGWGSTYLPQDNKELQEFDLEVFVKHLKDVLENNDE